MVRLRAAALVATALAAAAATGAAPAAADSLSLSLVSDSPLAGGGDSADTTGAQTSADGARVYFTTSEALVPQDTDTSQDVYMRAGGVTTLVSDGPADPDPNNAVSLTQVSTDGTKALLRTDAPLTSADGDARFDLYLRDTTAGTTTLISGGPALDNTHDVAPFPSGAPDLSKVSFGTQEKIDTTNDTDSASDVYVWSGATPQLVSDGPALGTDPDLDAFPGAISSDGTLVTFSAAESLVPADGDSTHTDVYQRTLGSSLGPDMLLSDRVQPGTDGADEATLAVLSRDSSHVFFFTTEQIVASDMDHAIDLYESVSGGAPVLVSGRVKDSGVEETDVTDVGTTADGSKVFFGTAESLVTADGDSSTDVYERSAGTTTLVSDSPSDQAKDAQLQRASPDGSHVFWTTDEALVPEDGDSSFDVYTRSAGVTTLVSDRVQPGADAAQDALFRDTSTDGTRVFFVTAEPLVAADGDAASSDVYQRSGTTTTLLSDRQKAGPDEAVDAGFSAATPDGSRVFLSTKEQLLDADADSERDVYGAQIVADQPPGGNPPGGNPPGGNPPGGNPPGGNPPPGLLPGKCANVKVGTPGADTLTGTVAGDKISAGSGNDTVNGLAGSDCLLGQAGDDKLNGGAGKDTLTGASGKDKLSGGTQNDKLDGGKGNDKLDGGAGNDNLIGGAGKDSLKGGKGKNKYNGGKGDDTINARNKKKETVNCGPGKKDRATVDKKDKVKGCEVVKRR